jgi:SAM-dependent methyltransferase
MDIARPYNTARAEARKRARPGGGRGHRQAREANAGLTRMPQALYDRIGTTYASTRQSDPRIAAAIMRALGDSQTVINVGAGTDAYEPTDRAVVAVEPSAHMIRQRRTGTAFSVQASAEALPFRDDTFDAALAALTVHHWTDWRRGLDEMKRAADRLVVFTFEAGDIGNFWLTDTYFQEIVELVRRRCPSVAGPRAPSGRLQPGSRRYPARLRRWVPRRVLASTRGVSRSTRASGNLGVCAPRPRRRRARRGAAQDRSGIRGLGRSVRPPSATRGTRRVLPNPVD